MLVLKLVIVGLAPELTKTDLAMYIARVYINRMQFFSNATNLYPGGIRSHEQSPQCQAEKKH
jgi:hypothetical protein